MILNISAYEEYEAHAHVRSISRVTRGQFCGNLDSKLA